MNSFKEAVSSCFVPTNFQMLSQAVNTESLSDVYTSDFEELNQHVMIVVGKASLITLSLLDSLVCRHGKFV